MIHVVRAVGRVYYTPFQVQHALTADGICVYHGNVAAGRLYVALYDCDPANPPQPRNRLAVSADTLVSGTYRKQYVALTATVQLQPGTYFGAVEVDNITDTYPTLYRNLAQFGAGPISGQTSFIEDLGPYAIPPNPATPVVIANVDHSMLMLLRVASIP